jgi:large subunit ribosomal protein L6
MINLIKESNEEKYELFLKSSIGNIKLNFIDKTLKIPENVKIFIYKRQIFFKGFFGILTLKYINDILVFLKGNELILNFKKIKNKKSILNLYFKLIKIKIKGVLQGFKLNLILSGIGFKIFIENDKLILKLGFSHSIYITIPSSIKINIQGNNIIFSSIDYIFLTQYVNYIRNYKKPEPYKGKGLLFKNEKIFRKDGKKSKK